ncbi:MAG: hypothetical protein Q7R97_04995 [Candidatus Daviesbacteria bacterium]|nr:hypothetical protein [Candidatus Daviesbacteria bacterium]
MQQNFTLIIFTLILIPILLFFYWRLRLKKIAIYKSLILGKIEVFEKYNKEKVLTINSYPQGVSIKDQSIEKSYWFTVAELVVKFCSSRKNSQVLLLGLGANTIPSLIAQKNPKILQTIIEIDKFIIEACRKYFNLDQLPNYQILKADAFQILKEHLLASSAYSKFFILNSLFDIIIVDIFTGQPPYVSLNSNQPNFIEKIMPFLKNDGMIIFNRPAHNQESRNGGFELEKYLKTKFQKTDILEIFDPRRFKNHVITGWQKK